MKYRARYLVLVGGLLLAGLVPATYHLLRQIEEDRVVERYLAANGLAGLPVTRDTAIRISDQVRRDFNTDERSFKVLNMTQRPFLREDTGFLLRYKEGLCGEGTRVLVNLLRHAGFDATRITLYDRDLNSAHTLVSIELNGSEFLVDTIKSDPDINAYLRSTEVSPDDFRLLHYSDDYSVRVGTSWPARMKRPPHRFFDAYWLYSYEATPYAKLLSKAGMDLRVFNFDRPPAPLSALAEKPRLIMAGAASVAALFAVVLVLATGALWRRLRRRDQSKQMTGQAAQASMRVTSSPSA